MQCSIVFSDIDCTLLDSSNRMLPGTRRAIESLQSDGIPFVLISARSPSGIYPILERYDFQCPIICYCGSHIVDSDRSVLYTTGMTQNEAAAVLEYIDSSGIDAAVGIYSGDTWLAPDPAHPRVIQEECAVEAQAVPGTVEDLPHGAMVNKLLLMGPDGSADEIARRVQEAFPGLTAVASMHYLVEVMPRTISKATGVRRYCAMNDIPMDGSIAFGDYYNDEEMLKAVAHPVLMGNAPADLRARFGHITSDCDHEGILHALQTLGVVQ